MMLACAAAPAAWDTAAPPLEHSVKAAFLYKFLGFIDWSEPRTDSPARPLVIGVVAAADIAAELERIVPGRSVDGRSITVRRLRAGELPDGIDLLFVGRGGEHRLPRLAPWARRQSALVVCESVRALPPGCAINFVLADGRVRFEVSPRAAEASGITLSSRLLGVALRVEGRTP